MLGIYEFPEGIKSYQEAKRFVMDLKIVKQYNSPTVSVTHYKTNTGAIYIETESHLESPYDDYSLTKVG